MALLKKNVTFTFVVPFWLMKGRAHLKHELAQRVDIEAATLPYHQEFLRYLRDEHTASRSLLLVTASHHKFAQQVADHLGLFSKVLATEGETNLSGSKKIERLVSEFDGQSFVYAGNARADLSIWLHCRQAIFVNPKTGVKSAACKVAQVERVFDDRSGEIAAYTHALRLHQWLKNLLVFVPLFASHRIDEVNPVVKATTAFFAFGLCASTVYILNDLFDLAADRQHPRKRHRMFACGRLPVVQGALLAPVLLLAAPEPATSSLPSNRKAASARSR